jgi:hypothetical protein
MTVGRIAPSAYYPEGGYTGRLGEVEYDPFERLPDGILLCESFARARFDDPELGAEWVEKRGAVHLAAFVGSGYAPPVRGPDGFHDETREIIWQQELVRWHLDSLVRLSDHLPGRGLTPPEHPEGWDPAWSRPVLSFGGDLVRGVPGRAPLYIPARVQASAEPQGSIPHQMSLEQYGEWWRTTRAAYERLVEEDPPVIGARAPDPWGSDDGRDLVEAPEEARHMLMDLGDGWWSLARLQVRLLLDSIQRAGEPRIDVWWSLDEGDADGERLGPLGVREVRSWTSVLAPIHLQLFEALRRVSEGDRGAGRCRECGQPFLTLDARRAAFCTDRERLRWAQRDHRRRAAERAAAADEGQEPAS